MTKRVLALIDGEHHLPVTRAALQSLDRMTSFKVVGAIFIGRTEKVGPPSDLKVLDVPVIVPNSPLEGIRDGIEQFSPDTIYDLSDEPVVGYAERMEMACVILSLGIAYKGPDFEFTPPSLPRVCKKPSIAVIGTGKRIGKTAVSAYMARVLSGLEGDFDESWLPCIVTMDTGGPSEPEIIRADELAITPSYLLDMSKKGCNASSGHFEDALMSRVPTVGCRCCGGGFSGQVFESTVAKGAEMANDLPVNLVILKGSGASIPDVASDEVIVVVGANQPLENVSGYMGPYRIRRASLAVLTLCEPPSADMTKVKQLDLAIRAINPSIKVVWTIFRPKPLIDVEQKKAIVATTAPRECASEICDHLLVAYGCETLAITHSLATGSRLRQELGSAIARFPDADVLITELKAASVDVAASIAIDNGLEVVFMDNTPEVVGGDADLDTLVIETALSAQRAFKSK
ncbi:2,3-diphosphoglycerate synthetase [bacterium]|nr:2,3-diphosphoglycerate synthetase [bacterium]